MLTLAFAGVLAMLSTSPEEPTREEKFRGALLAELSPEVSGKASAEHELKTLNASRPNLRIASVVLGFGIAATLAGPVVFGLIFVIPFGEVGVWIAVLAGGLSGLGIITGIIGGILLAVLGDELKHVDARIHELEQQQLSVPPAAQRFDAPPRLVLARF